MNVPKTTRRLVVVKLSPNFRDAVEIQTQPIDEVKSDQIMVQNYGFGIQATDVNLTNGIKLPGVNPPFYAGFEAVGIVVFVGDHAADVKMGDAVVYMEIGAFSEYHVVSQWTTIPTPDLEYIPLYISGLTATIALTVNGLDIANKEPKSVKKIGLVTGAGGGTGQFAVQLMLLAGYGNVIATCSTNAKMEFLTQLGATRNVRIHLIWLILVST